MRELHIVTALIRRRDELLMVLQAAPHEEPYWALPGGRAEPAEFVTDALAREVQEETGISVLDPGRLAFTAQVEDLRERLFLTVWTWDVKRWEGEVAPQDPDELVLEAGWRTLPDALEHLRWPPTLQYVLGELEPGSHWQVRVDSRGREDWLGSFGPVY